MTLKLIALDIDGTLTNDEKKITEDTRSTLLNFQKQGVRVMLASARPVPGLYSAASELRLCDHHGILTANASMWKMLMDIRWNTNAGTIRWNA